MGQKPVIDLFTEDVLAKLFPKNRTNEFFDALFGDPTEGPYNITLSFKEHRKNKLHFEFHLTERPGRCLACNVTYGLPNVFARHPVLDVKGLVQDIDQLLDGRSRCVDWKLGSTREITRKLHIIPLIITLE